MKRLSSVLILLIACISGCDSSGQAVQSDPEAKFEMWVEAKSKNTKPWAKNPGPKSAIIY